MLKLILLLRKTLLIANIKVRFSKIRQLSNYSISFSIEYPVNSNFKIKLLKKFLKSYNIKMPQIRIFYDDYDRGGTIQKDEFVQGKRFSFNGYQRPNVMLTWSTLYIDANLKMKFITRNL